MCFILFNEHNEYSSEIIGKLWKIIGWSLLGNQLEQLDFKDNFFLLITNFKAFDAPLNIVRFHPIF